MTLTIKPSRRSSAQKQLALDEAAREDVTRLNLRIPKSLHRDLRLQTVREGKGATITNIVVRALREHLDQLANDDCVK